MQLKWKIIFHPPPRLGFNLLIFPLCILVQRTQQQQPPFEGKNKSTQLFGKLKGRLQATHKYERLKIRYLPTTWPSVSGLGLVEGVVQYISRRSCSQDAGSSPPGFFWIPINLHFPLLDTWGVDLKYIDAIMGPLSLLDTWMQNLLATVPRIQLHAWCDLEDY